MKPISSISSLNLRPVRDDDAEALRAIYNWAVAHTTATMDTEPRTPTGQSLWIEAHNGDPYPALVAEAEDQIVGYASLSPYSPKPGYRTTTENSLYVHPDWQSRGVGAALLSALIAEARQRGFRLMLALITADNEASLRLHARQGFADAGTLRGVGRKFDRWIDVTFMQLALPEFREKKEI